MPVQVKEVEQAVGVHDRHTMQVHQEVPLIGGDTVQGLQEHPARVLIEFAFSATEDRVATVLNAHVDQISFSRHPQARSCGPPSRPGLPPRRMRRALAGAV